MRTIDGDHGDDNHHCESPTNHDDNNNYASSASPIGAVELYMNKIRLVITLLVIIVINDNNHRAPSARAGLHILSIGFFSVVFLTCRSLSGLFNLGVLGYRVHLHNCLSSLIMIRML